MAVESVCASTAVAIARATSEAWSGNCSAVDVVKQSRSKSAD